MTWDLCGLYSAQSPQEQPPTNIQESSQTTSNDLLNTSDSLNSSSQTLNNPNDLQNDSSALLDLYDFYLNEDNANDPENPNTPLESTPEQEKTLNDIFNSIGERDGF